MKDTLRYERPLQQREITILNEQLKQLNMGVKGYLRFLLIWILLVLLVGTIAFFKLDATNRGLLYLLFITITIYISVGF